MNVITLTTGELEKLLKNPESVGEDNRLALLRKGIETELAERRLGRTIEEMQGDIRGLEDELEQTRAGYHC